MFQGQLQSYILKHANALCKNKFLVNKNEDDFEDFISILTFLKTDEQSSYNFNLRVVPTS